MSSATSRKLLSWKRETLRFPRSSTRTRSGNVSFVLTTAVQGVIYCQCGRLMTKDAAENKRYISGILDTFSIPRFYIRKNRPRGHRYGKAQGCKEYHTAHQLAKKCRKKKYDSIHDRFIRDKTFRKAMIEVGRTEQMIIEMDKHWERGPHLHGQQERNWVLPWQLVDPLKCAARWFNTYKVWTRI